MKKTCILAVFLCSFILLTGCLMQKKEEVKETETATEKTTEEKTTESQKMEQETKACIVIDAGHQKYQNSDLEPIGPGASESKMKVSSGTEGVVTGTPEYVVNLQVSKKLKKLLMDKGYEVIMIREEHDVDISNRERAEIANEAKADVFLRIHCNSSESSSTKGALALCPDDENPYCSDDVIRDSLQLSEIVLESLCQETGAKQLSMIRTSTMSGINWCEVPVSIVEMGFMSNEEEDRKLNDEEYQNKLAKGIASGVEKYLLERSK